MKRTHETQLLKRTVNGLTSAFSRLFATQENEKRQKSAMAEQPTTSMESQECEIHYLIQNKALDTMDEENPFSKVSDEILQHILQFIPLRDPKVRLVDRRFNGAMAAIAEQKMKLRQQSEIAYLIQNKKSVLEETNNNSAIKEYYEKLEKEDHFEKREQILDALNKEIINLRIKKNSRILNCAHCYLTRIPLKFIQSSISQFYWTSFEELNFAGNQLTTLPESIGSLTTLRGLYLDNNQLTTLPESIGSLAALVQLDLNNNQLTTLPKSIGSLTALKQLCLNNNQLTTLPESIGSLTTLQYLYLNNNQLTTLPEGISSLTALQRLDLWNNQLTTLPESIGSLAALQWLYLGNNQLTTLPEGIDKLRFLNRLTLEQNNLSALPDVTEKILFEFNATQLRKVTKAQVLASQKTMDNSYENEQKTRMRP